MEPAGQGREVTTVCMMGMRLYVTSFCCCLSLESGVKIIAYAHLAIGTFLTAACGSFAVKMKERMGTVDDAEDLVYSKIFLAALIFTACSFTHVVLALLLISGLNKRSAKYVHTWVTLMGLLLLVGTAYAGLVGVRAARSCDDILMLLLKMSVWFGAMGYIMVTVYSFGLVLKSEEDAAEDAAQQDRLCRIARERDPSLEQCIGPPKCDSFARAAQGQPDDQTECGHCAECCNCDDEEPQPNALVRSEQ
ncbi:uncharacterized protein LOC114349684 [Ostrinia furnacalis]|uniref:uncharacterized protein LOC114349684 n=1 Tax=Ostrinia furnacalis TaxID=93504 RepID=UPI00103F643D|nr:uncharacterized protein LOC114349684 [Ostrinia furnacalis]XP_028155957.1 uncharacterized protein LOC114349684 [Ostrinia furnacalis]